MAIAAKKIDENDVLKDMIAEDGFAIFASRAGESRGQVFSEPESKMRSTFQRDRDRVIHSTAFRRLKHKTQVFVSHEGDNYRTRLTHSIEVAQVARSLARALRMDEDLAEVCALAHDVGHTPFAHVGEDALKECMTPYGGFDHNDQTIRVVTLLENRYPRFKGLNLSWEALEGLVKHNGPVVKEGIEPNYEITLNWLKDQTDLMLNTYASPEAQAAGIADDIAYNCHDLDDGLSAGLFTLDDLVHIPLLGSIIHDRRTAFPDAPERIIRAEMVRELMGYMVGDVLGETKHRLDALRPKHADDVRHADQALIGFSEKMQAHDKQIRRFLWDNFYRNPSVARMRFKVFGVVQDLFAAFMEHSKTLPVECQQQIQDTPEGWDAEDWRARIIADYIASMTDKNALLEHQSLYDIGAALK